MMNDLETDIPHDRGKFSQIKKKKKMTRKEKI